jgi:hypothetical protein
MSFFTTVIAASAVLAMAWQPATSSALSQREIAEALADGGRSEEEVPLAPYSLKHHLGRSRGPNVAIYTPYLRIALASRVAHKDNKSLAPADLPEWITSPNVLVVFRSPCPPDDCSYAAGARMHNYTRDLPPSVVFSGPHTAADDATRPRTSAVALAHDLRFLEAIGGQPFKDAVLAAIFPIEAVRPGASLVARWDFGMDRVPSGGRITSADTRGWRYR